METTTLQTLISDCAGFMEAYRNTVVKKLSIAMNALGTLRPYEVEEILSPGRMIPARLTEIIDRCAIENNPALVQRFTEMRDEFQKIHCEVVEANMQHGPADAYAPYTYAFLASYLPGLIRRLHAFVAPGTSPEASSPAATTATPSPESVPSSDAPTSPSALPEHGLNGEARAVAILYQHPDWTNRQIAMTAGISERQIYRYKRYTDARALLKEQGKAEIPRGHRTDAGDLEAYD